MYLKFTIGAVNKLVQSNRGPISVALKAYLYRIFMDAKDLSRDNARVRLVKGIYSEDIEEYVDIQMSKLDNIELLHSI